MTAAIRPKAPAEATTKPDIIRRATAGSSKRTTSGSGSPMFGLTQTSTKTAPAKKGRPLRASTQAAIKAPNTMTETWPMKRLMKPTAHSRTQPAQIAARRGEQQSREQGGQESAGRRAAGG